MTYSFTEAVKPPGAFAETSATPYRNMTIDEIRDRLATSLYHHQRWLDVLDDTNPGHYGVADVECEVALTDIWVNIPEKTFSFKNATLSFSARMLGSSDSDGIDMDFEKVVSGVGTFEFLGATELSVVEFKINEPLDLLEE